MHYIVAKLLPCKRERRWFGDDAELRICQALLDSERRKGRRKNLIKANVKYAALVSTRTEAAFVQPCQALPWQRVHASIVHTPLHAVSLL